jgi:hypothetical protein
MSRLRHSYGGYLRSMQIASKDLYIFVEGKQSDRFFYSRICETIPDLSSRYEICIAEQLPGGAGGKQSLLGFHDFLRKRKELATSLGGKRKATLFLIDKDLDDLQHRMIRSRHVVYTEHYDVQNYIFMHGDLRTGAASAASLDPARLSADLGNAPAWCRRACERWREWIALCLCMTEDRISCEANYRVISPVQTRLSEPTDAALYETLTRNIACRVHIPLAQFRQRIEATTRKVDRYFSNGLHHRIFKGKWFSAILADQIDITMAGLPYDRNGLASRLPSVIAATIDFTEPWADHFRNSLQGVIPLL